MMSSGRWFIASGTRWRQGQKVSFVKNPDSGGYTVPFGPRAPGNFVFTRASNNSGIWNYDNGRIDPNNPQINNQTFQTFDLGGGITTRVQTNPGDSAWTNSSSLGTQVYQWSDPSTTPSTPYWSYYNVGSFTVNNIGQFNAATFGNTTAVSFDLALNQSVEQPTVRDEGLPSLVYDNSFWCPYVEIGFWTGSVLSISYSFQSFSFGNSFEKNIPATLYPVATSLTDSYNFSSIGFSSNGTPAPSNPTLVSAPFNSIRQGTSGSVLYSYSLNPLSGNRVFKNNGIEVTPVAVTENLSVSLDASCYENRLAFLLMGQSLSMYDFGFSLGPVATRVHSALNYQNSVVNPNNPDNVLLTNTGSLVQDQWSFGAFGGLDLRVNLGNTFFGCSVDYVYMSQITQEIEDIQSTIRPGGCSISLGGGFRL